MVHITGKDSTKQVDLVVEIYDTAHTKDEAGNITQTFPTIYAHPDGRNAVTPDGKPQSQLPLNRRENKDPKTKDRFPINNSAAYAKSQMDQIFDTAAQNGNMAPIMSRDGQQLGMYAGVKADLTRARDGSGFAVRTDTLQPSELSVGPDAQGRDVKARIIDVHKAAYAEKQAAKQQQEQAAAQQNQPQVAQAPAYGTQAAQPAQAAPPAAPVFGSQPQTQQQQGGGPEY